MQQAISVLKKAQQGLQSLMQPHHWITLGTLLAASLILSGCQSTPTAPTPVVHSKLPPAEYRLGEGDMITVNVWRNPELTVTAPIRPDGKIALSLIGDIQAAGSSVAELTQSLNNSLVQYVRNPQVSVTLLESASAEFTRRVRLTGAVHAPQSLPYRHGMTVLDLVLLAGGPNDFARANKTKLYRTTAEGVQIYDIKLEDILKRGDVSTNFPLQPQDIVTVPERYF